MELTIKQIAKYLLMDHPVQKCILHVIGREEKKVMHTNEGFSRIAYVQPISVEVDDMRAIYFKASNNYILSLSSTWNEVDGTNAEWN